MRAKRSLKRFHLYELECPSDPVVRQLHQRDTLGHKYPDKRLTCNLNLPSRLGELGLNNVDIKWELEPSEDPKPAA